jgi:hypothetical protein
MRREKSIQPYLKLSRSTGNSFLYDACCAILTFGITFEIRRDLKKDIRNIEVDLDNDDFASW